MEDVPCLPREPLVHTWWEPRTNLHAGQKNFEMFGPSKRHIASSQIESGSEQSTPMHLGCTSTVPGCQGESTWVAIGKLYESSLLHYCWRASQMMHQWWIHFPFIAVTSAVVGTTIWHSSGISNLDIFAGNQTPKIQIQYNLCFFLPLPPYSMLTTQELSSRYLGPNVRPKGRFDTCSTSAGSMAPKWLTPCCAIRKNEKKTSLSPSSLIQIPPKIPVVLGSK